MIIKRFLCGVVIAFTLVSGFTAFAVRAENNESIVPVANSSASVASTTATVTVTGTPAATATPGIQLDEEGFQKIGDFEVTYNAVGDLTISNYFGESNDIVVPEKINGCVVRRFDPQAMSSKQRKRIESISFPKTITYIEGEKGYDCLPWYDNLKKIVVDKDNKTFKTIKGMLVNKKTHKLLICPQKLKLTKFIVPKEITKIEGTAFTNVNIKSIVVGKQVKEISTCAFAYSNLRKAVIKANISKIGEGVFSNCKKLKKIVLPSTIKYTEVSAFRGCVNLKSIKLTKKLECIGMQTFLECKRLKHINIGQSVKFIDERAFMGCKSLKKVKIPKNCKIGKDAFPKTCKVIRQ